MAHTALTVLCCYCSHVQQYVYLSVSWKWSNQQLLYVPTWFPLLRVWIEKLLWAPAKSPPCQVAAAIGRINKFKLFLCGIYAYCISLVHYILPPTYLIYLSELFFFVCVQDTLLGLLLPLCTYYTYHQQHRSLGISIQIIIIKRKSIKTQ